ncbi:DUF349 domain-containing protein [Frankia sp. CNm7]|uniref:DUF349 domain-containing protein n=1 Tax=Frankia nepalensis TaxID=1836974 RepID=A0A937R6S6_9ACTN|nr:DUF349 domain-containing protein [Frankia nepalensis]MBL7497680.1 DUF349 domain-containing protein [Frankia nepalensis]MBL7514733.1 DUF349 domain-containing protein [Frankia nepalensis]MBL7522372.1 DUF349 domain-containing protein [Frankia nepalensis]MBL7626331.1 DUF349 domain-containing protein [Frankia nepalensis]
MSDGTGSEWGRVADDGTVYVRTSEGERAVGSWRAGSPDEGLAHFVRRYEDLSAEVELLEKRVMIAGVDPVGVAASAQRLLDGLDGAAVVGDLDALRARLAALLGVTESRRSQVQAERAARAAQAVAAKEELVAEAERLAKSSDWKTVSERFRTIGEEFRAITGVDKRTDSGLWRRIAAAREEFARRRTAHFAALDTQRARSKERKETLIAEAESLAESTDWGATTARFRALMAEWKTAGRAAKEVDDELWARFRAAQDAFFSRRNAVNAERDAAARANQTAKEALLAEAAELDPADAERSLRKLREIQERWDAVGRVPRDAVGQLERQLTAIGDRIREAADARWSRQGTETSPFVAKLRESVSRLEEKLERAKASGRTKDIAKVEADLATQRAWLAQSER